MIRKHYSPHKSLRHAHRRSTLQNCSRVCRRITLQQIVPLFGLLYSATAAAAVPPAHPLNITIGTPAEQRLLVKSSGTQVISGVRHIDPGQFCLYGFPTAGGAHCRLTLSLDGDSERYAPAVTVYGADDRPIQSRVERSEGIATIVWTVPDKWQPGARIRVSIGAKEGPIDVRDLRFQQTDLDADGDGIPDSIERMLTAGLPAGSHPTRFRNAADASYLALDAGALPTSGSELQSDAVFLSTADTDTIAAWKARGYTVWSRLRAAIAAKGYAAQHPEEAQTGASGKPIFSDGTILLAPTAGLNNVLQTFANAALQAGSGGVSIEQPIYSTEAGYESSFRQAWQAQYHSPWQTPLTVDARWRTAQLMAMLETNWFNELLHGVGRLNPQVRRFAALRSPLDSLQQNIICPQNRIASLPDVSDLIGLVDVQSAAMPVRYGGSRQEHTFSTAYLEYSSLLHTVRGQGKRLWFSLDPLGETVGFTLPDQRERFEQTLIAALLFPDVTSYAIATDASRISARATPDYATEINTLLATLEDMHAQPDPPGRTGSGDPTKSDGRTDILKTDTRGELRTDARADSIGMLLSDTAQWQRTGEDASDLDGIYGMTLPLLQRGIPVQIASLDRAADPGYLNVFKTLLISYDLQKPVSPRIQTALSDWVRRGGSLIFFGGSDAYNDASDSWWRQARLAAPQFDLWRQLGFGKEVGTKFERQITPPEDTRRYKSLLTSGQSLAGDRRSYTIDLTQAAKETGSVALRFSDSTPQDGNGALLASAELRADGQVVAAFAAGTELENRFLIYDNGSRSDRRGRFADETASWTYQFDNLPRNVPITITLDMGSGFAVSAASALPDFRQTLLATDALPPLAEAVPRLRIGAAYPATLYPTVDDASHISPLLPKATTEPKPFRGAGGADKAGDIVGGAITVLYNLRSGGAPVWMHDVGRGLAINVGIAPGFFSASERSANLLREIVRYAQQRAGVGYREPNALRLRRGRYTVVHTFNRPLKVEGRMIDLLSPTLAVADDRVIPPRTSALLCDIGLPELPPHIGFVSGRLEAKVETPRLTSFFVRAPQGTSGAARLHCGARRITGVRGIDRLGRPVAVQSIVEGSTVLLRYPNDPDGIVIRVGWQ